MRDERDANGEVIPACTGRRHWWTYIHQSVQQCQTCGAIRYRPAGTPGR